MADQRCLIFQRDNTILLETASPGFPAARDALRRFAELVQSAGGYHLYRPSEVTLWAAAASGFDARQIVDVLERYGQHPPPAPLIARIQELSARYGRLRLEGAPGSLRLTGDDAGLLRQLAGELGLDEVVGGFVVPDERRGVVKRELAGRGYPVADRAALAAAEAVDFSLRPEVQLRPYQREAVGRFVALGWPGAVVLLPCGAGKTVVGVAAAARLGARTLVVTPSRTIGEQWIEHLRRLTTLRSRQVGAFRRGSPPPAVESAWKAITAFGGVVAL